MLIKLKKLLPEKFLLILRTWRQYLWFYFDSKKPYLNYIKYSGFNLYYNRGNALINRIRFGNTDRIYESFFCKKIVEELKNKKASIFVDIGSNIGLISLYVLSKLPNLKIYAFEPGLFQNFLFRITIIANQIAKRIELYNKAIDITPGIKKFVIHNDVNNSGDGFINTERCGPVKMIDIETTTLDIWWNYNRKPFVDVIKIDTEGAELWILEGGKECIKACKPTIFLEISSLNLKNYPYKHMDIFDWFVSHDFELYTIYNTKCVRNEFDNIIVNEDSFIARPKKI